MANAQTSTWGQIADVLFLNVHSSSYWIILKTKGYGGRKGKKIITRMSEHSRQITEDNCREEMHPKSLEREVLKNHHDVVSRIGPYAGMRSVQSLLSFL